MTQDLELRVLTGIHHGARCQARDGALIGSDERCDIVLCDDGIADEAARLWIGIDTWRIFTQGDASDTMPEVPFGTPLELGPILVTIAHAAAPWPDAGMLQSAGMATKKDTTQQAVPNHESAGAQTAADPAWSVPAATTRGDEGELAAKGAVAARAQSSRRRKGSGLRWAVGGPLILLVFGSVASFPPAKVPSMPRAQAIPPRDPEILLRARHLLLEQGYAPRVRASLGAEQEVVITGWVRDDTEHDRLATALSTIWPLPAMRVGKESQVAMRMDMHIRDMDLHAVIAHLATGYPEIRGVAASDAVRQEALRRWREDADAMVLPVAMTMLLAAEVADAFNTAVAAAGLPPLASSWKDKALRIDAGALDRPQLEQLQTVLDMLNPLYMDALRLDGENARATESMPFRVRTIVGGRQPWVILEDGTRIVIGGTHGAYRLTSVEDGSVIFDGPSTAIITR
jgi:type III secretion protein D